MFISEFFQPWIQGGGIGPSCVPVMCLFMPVFTGDIS